MKNKFLTVGLIAAMMVPAAAAAQTRQIQRDRQEVREERRDLNQARRSGDRRDVREERRDVRDARQDLRESRQDWRQDRRYSNYRAPYRYQRFSVGAQLRPNYYAQSHRLGYDRRWGVNRPGRNLTYVRHHNDLLLVNVRNGKVIRVYRNHFRRYR